MRIAGGILALGGLALALRSGILLAGRGRPRRGPIPRFVIAGPYRRVRNPLFIGLLLALAGLTMLVRRADLAWIPAALAVGIHLWVVHGEEPRLRERFGDAYEAYLKAVPRWLPRLGGSTE